MKTKAKYQPERIASQDPTRYHLQHVHLDVEAKLLAATNGHMLVTVPCEPQEGDTSGLIPSVMFRDTRKVSGRKAQTTEIRANGYASSDAGDVPRPAGTFPPYQSVIPKYRKGDEGTVTIGINAAYLLELARALGASAQCPQVEITIEAKAFKGKRPRYGHGNQGAIVVKVLDVLDDDTPEALGILMPCTSTK